MSLQQPRRAFVPDLVANPAAGEAHVKMSVRVPVSLHRAIKMDAVGQGLSLQEQVIRLLQAHELQARRGGSRV